jgi:hypothetical protein
MPCPYISAMRERLDVIAWQIIETRTPCTSDNIAWLAPASPPTTPNWSRRCPAAPTMGMRSADSCPDVLLQAGQPVGAPAIRFLPAARALLCGSGSGILQHQVRLPVLPWVHEPEFTLPAPGTAPAAPTAMDGGMKLDSGLGVLPGGVPRTTVCRPSPRQS